MVDKSIYVLFFLAILIHNIEEALWLPAWSKHAGRFVKRMDAQEFRFAVLIVTILALMATSLIIVYPHSGTARFVYFGFLGAMLVNVIFPHLAATIALKKYTPGLISGMLLNIPINVVIIYRALNAGIISLSEVIVSTIVIGVILLLSLPSLFRLGKIIKCYLQD